MASTTAPDPPTQNMAGSPSEMSQQMQQQVERAAPNEAATKLIESIDDFLGHMEKKFKTISDEVLGKLDDMAERCDRLEQEMLLGVSSASASPTDDNTTHARGQADDAASLKGKDDDAR